MSARPALERVPPPANDPVVETANDLLEVLYTDGSWRLVHVRARWHDEAGREVVQLLYRRDDGSQTHGSFLVDEAKMRDAR